jgi:hypothetical protein
MKHSSTMTEAFQSDGPHLELAEKLQLLGQFVGSWDVEITKYKHDGSRGIVLGEWHFGWVLEGRAIQDVWIAPKRSLREDATVLSGDYGGTLKFTIRRSTVGGQPGSAQSRVTFFPSSLARSVTRSFSKVMNQASRGNGYFPTLLATRLSGARSSLTTGGLRIEKFRKCQRAARPQSGRCNSRSIMFKTKFSLE